MLKEKPCRQVPGEPARRWILDDYFDLVIWSDPANTPFGFQLCYDKTGWEHALTWTQKRGFTHSQVDGGEGSPHSNCTPILVPDGNFPAEVVRKQFLSRSIEIDPQIRELVMEKIEEYSTGSKV